MHSMLRVSRLMLRVSRLMLRVSRLMLRMSRLMLRVSQLMRSTLPELRQFKAEVDMLVAVAVDVAEPRGLKDLVLQQDRINPAVKVM